MSSFCLSQTLMQFDVEVEVAEMMIVTYVLLMVLDVLLVVQM